MGDTNSRPAYVDVAEVCRDWGCSRSKGYAIIKQLSEQMKSENPRLLTMSPTGNPKGYKRLQDAIDDSSKDLLRYSETLNATKMRLYRMGRTEEAERIERFQNKTDIPYILKYGAAAVLTEEKFITSDMINVTAERHIDNVELIVIYTKDLNSLIDGMYRRAAIC